MHLGVPQRVLHLFILLWPLCSIEKQEELTSIPNDIIIATSMHYNNCTPLHPVLFPVGTYAIVNTLLCGNHPLSPGMEHTSEGKEGAALFAIKLHLPKTVE